MLYIITLGFDEKFAIRFLLRHGVKSNDKVLIILPDDQNNNHKVQNALNNLISLLNNLVKKENVIILEVSLKEPILKNVKKIKQKILEIGENTICANLSGGMRALILLVVSTLLLLKNLDVKVEVEFENFEGYTEIPIKAFLVPKNDRWIRILKSIYNGYGIRETAKNLGLSPATISREAKKLQELGLIDEKFNLTDSGKLYLELYE
ncbi:CRISPR-associated CARF protein Csa3 [Methanocaldococcus sp. 10A]